MPAAGCRFQPWPEDALNAVAAARLKALDVTAETRAALQGLCRGIHTSVEALSTRFKAQVRMQAALVLEQRVWAWLQGVIHAVMGVLLGRITVSGSGLWCCELGSDRTVGWEHAH